MEWSLPEISRTLKKQSVFRSLFIIHYPGIKHLVLFRGILASISQYLTTDFHLLLLFRGRSTPVLQHLTTDSSCFFSSEVFMLRFPRILPRIHLAFSLPGYPCFDFPGSYHGFCKLLLFRGIHASVLQHLTLGTPLYPQKQKKTQDNPESYKKILYLQNRIR